MIQDLTGYSGGIGRLNSDEDRVDTARTTEEEGLLRIIAFIRAVDDWVGM